MIQDYYTTSFESYRVSSSVDANNFEIETDVINLSGSGRFEPLSGAERYFSDKKEAYTTHRLFCEVLDIVEKDTIKINSLDYDIDAVSSQEDASLQHHLEIILIGKQ